MKLLHNIGRRINSNYNTRKEIERCAEPLGFDGVYHNVYLNQDVLEGKDVTLFVMGDYVGKDNSFDVGMPREEYCTWEQIEELVHLHKCKLGWHTWSHRDLTKLSREEVIREVRPPFPMKYFTYPYGAISPMVVDCVRDAGFEKAWSVHQGDGSTFQLNRTYLNW